MTPTLRTALPTDAPAIANLHAESWRFAYRGAYPDTYLDGPIFEDRLQVWTSRLTNPKPNQHVILAEDGGELTGFACSFGADDPRWGTLLDNLHVRPNLHRQGTGRLLVTAVAAWCREASHDAGLYLWVLDQNARARAFYASLGGTEEDSKTTQTPGGGSTVAIRCVWPPDQLETLLASTR